MRLEKYEVEYEDNLGLWGVPYTYRTAVSHQFYAMQQILHMKNKAWSGILPARLCYNRLRFIL